MKNPAIGSHLVSPRGAYTHHGIYVGSGQVIHYSGLADGLQAGPVEEVSLEAFAGDQGYEVRTYEKPLPKKAIVQRALSRLGETSYSVLNNNCEHFCSWCITGRHKSSQVDQVKWTAATTSGMGSMAGLAARAAVPLMSTGAVAGTSGAGVMSGLATAGAAVGGGAAAGIGVIGAAPGLATASLVNKTILADDPTLEKSERESRKVGRAASYAGAGAAAAGSVGAVGALGSTAGLSAAGITSGLAAMGGSVGGGMVAGTMMATAAPAVAAAAVGYGVYKAVRWFK